MRISDWSSDVCSSDLALVDEVDETVVHHRLHGDLRKAVVEGRNGAAEVQKAERHGRVQLEDAARRGGKVADRPLRGLRLLQHASAGGKIGRASRRERGCQYV